jgi:hypothetical protein
MAYWYDLKPHRNKKNSGTIVLQEVFDTSEDVLSWVMHEEKKIEHNHKWVKKTRTILNFILLTSTIFFILLVISNWSAYSAFARDMISPERLETEKREIE